MKHHRITRYGACAVLFLCASLTLGALPRAETPLRSDEAPGPRADYTTVDFARESRNFAFDLFRELAAAESHDNLVVSPHSITTAILMLYAGAEGETATQITGALRLSASGDDLLRTAGLLQTSLMPDDHDEEERPEAEGDRFTLRVANGLWLDTGYPVRPDFLRRLQQHLQSETATTDFSGSPDESRHEINSWIAQQTEHRIPDLLPQGSITPLTRLVLVNAVYFFAGWQHPFIEGATRDGQFTTARGMQRTVPLMQLVAGVPVYMGDDTIAVELPYAGGDTSFIAFMPRDPDAFAQWQRTLDRDRFDRIRDALSRTRADVTLPRFSAETSLSLPQTMQRLGMRNVFHPDLADLSGISGNRDLYATDIIHRSVIDVDEQGTEAAAATAVIVGVRSVVGQDDPVRIRFDRPFVYALYDTHSESILFIGRVTDPSL